MQKDDMNRRGHGCFCSDSVRGMRNDTFDELEQSALHWLSIIDSSGIDKK